MARVSRRGLLIGGGAGVGLVVAWSLWPRDYPANLAVGPGEHAFGAWLKVGEDGRVTVTVPQAEGGQGVYTALPQIVADELGADWRQVGVEAAPVNPLYANPLGVAELFEGAFGRVPERFASAMLTAGSTSVRQFEGPARAAAATARALLQQAAARRWDVSWRDCGVDRGFVTHGTERLRFAELAADAVGGDAPDPPPVGQGRGAGRLTGKSVPRIDAPSKVDGSAQFAGDVRLQDMVHARVRGGPLGDGRLVSVDRTAADRVRGLVQVVETPRWVAAVGVTGWAAERGLDALKPRFETREVPPDEAAIRRALEAALRMEGKRVAGEGDVAAALGGGRRIEATYAVGLGVHASIETASAVAAYRDGRLELWCQTEAPAHARAAAARGAGVGEGDVVVHPMLIGGGFGARLETELIEQAAHLAVVLRRPVNLVRTRSEEIAQGRHRPPAMARMAASLGAGGLVQGWSAKIASPATGKALARRLLGRAATLASAGERYAVGGAAPPYRIPAWAVDHHAADIGIETGHLRGGAHGYTCFFNECFLDELAKAGGQEPVSFRIGMLGGNPRLARCLSTAASLGGWDGGRPGTGQGIACHSFRGGHIAVLAEADRSGGGRPRVTRLVAAADCGTMVNPDLVRQQIEGGLIFGLGLALGASTGLAAGRPTARGFDRLWLPLLVDAPEVTVDLIENGEASGGVSELAVPPVAPAVANALEAATGVRARTLPLL
ncbi:xanthine dehydrogenase family protein molybdopterin-binding subunit [Sphingomonas lenta]|uniref:Aldehyde oxidase n=1 Tax=Sphingomonas lenta TaxID=1141887 RepID=A0A2A2SD04_9SPHN|nr:molybdopterin cofactor-binding domain-containing protein [Sphingomonas lenta]PAX07174.1 aldehyde oxidase [Sphingomonas lenta]